MTTAPTESQITPDYARFAIGFDHRDRARLHALIDEVLDSDRWSEADMTARFEQAWAALERASRRRTQQLGRRRAGGAALRRGPGRDRAVPVEHVHGDAAGGDPRRRRGAVRRLQPRRPLHVVRRLRARRPSSTSPRPRSSSTSAATSRSSRADRRVLRGARDLPDRGLRARARRQLERAQARAATATRASTRCTRPRRSRPARAACSSHVTPS